MCTPLGSVELHPLLRPASVAPRAAAAAAGLLTADAAVLPLQWVYSQEVLREAAAASPHGALRFYDMAAAQRLYDDPRVPAGRKMCVTGRKAAGDISMNAELFLVVGESLAACGGDLDCLDLDKRVLEHFGPGGDYVGYIDSSMRRKLRLIDAQSERECPTRDLSTAGKFMQVVPVGRGATESTTGKVCPFGHGAAAAERELTSPAAGCPFAAGPARPSAEPWQPTGVDDAQSPGLAAALAVACIHAGENDERLLPRVDKAVRATHANSQASMYGRAAARLLAGVIRGEEVLDAAAAAAAVPRCPMTAGRLREALEHPGDDSEAVAAHFGTECHLEMVVPAAMHAIVHADSFEDGLERTLLAGGDVVGRAALVGSVLGALFGVGEQAGCVRREHMDRLGRVLAPAAGEQVATRCPVAKDDAPEFMHDAARLGVGDYFPRVDAVAGYVNLAGDEASYRFSQLHAGTPCFVCVFDTECCISHRFALPDVERRVWRPYAEGKCDLPCVGIARGASAAALGAFRKECAEKQRAGDRHIREISMPLVPDPDGAIFGQLAERIVPRLYLLNDAGQIRAATVGYDPSEGHDTNAVARILQEAEAMKAVEL